MISMNEMTLNTAFQKNIIPISYRDILSKIAICHACGKALVVNSNLTVLKCSNIKCPDKIAGRVLKSIRPFNLKGIGPEYIRSYIRENNITSVPDALTSPLLKRSFDEWRSVPRPVGAIIKELSIPGFDASKTDVITDNFKTFENFKVAILTFSIKHFCKKYRITFCEDLLNILISYLFYSEESDIKLFNKKLDPYREDMNNYISFLSYEDLNDYFIGLGLELLFEKCLGGKEGENYSKAFKQYWSEIEAMFSYCSEANITGTLIDIVITGEVTRTYKPDGTSIGDKDAFVAHINKILEPEGIFVRHAKKRKSCKYIIDDLRVNSESHRVGVERGNLIYSNELIDKLLEDKRNGTLDYIP